MRDSEIRTTKRQRDILKHALGLDYERKPYRNYFCSQPGDDYYDDCSFLRESGLMTEDVDINNVHTFKVTNSGEAEL